jgi:hypothetical protein
MQRACCHEVSSLSVMQLNARCHVCWNRLIGCTAPPNVRWYAHQYTNHLRQLSDSCSLCHRKGIFVNVSVERGLRGPPCLIAFTGMKPHTFVRPNVPTLFRSKRPTEEIWNEYKSEILREFVLGGNNGCARALRWIQNERIPDFSPTYVTQFYCVHTFTSRPSC